MRERMQTWGACAGRRRLIRYRTEAAEGNPVDGRGVYGSCVQQRLLGCALVWVR